MAEPINTKAIKKVANRWGDPQSQPPGTRCVRVPGVAENINGRATGDPKMDLALENTIALVTVRSG